VVRGGDWPSGWRGDRAEGRRGGGRTLEDSEAGRVVTEAREEEDETVALGWPQF
jgi:hypothetical protein